ncbi:MAG: rhodanese-like domain-containing protein [Nocardioidaceae bacterium]
MLRSEWAAQDTATLSVTTLETPGLGNRSYVADADGWAVAVDVPRDLDRVEEILNRRHARLGAVVETHLHNDYVTGGAALARRHGARYVVPFGPMIGVAADRGRPGEAIDVGPLRLRLIATPGHTDSHTAYSLHLEDGPAEAAFTGGSLLLGGNGRTDLMGSERAEELARAQYWTVRRLARLLPGQTRLLPTHGFGSFCLAGHAEEPAGDTLADQLTVNPAYLLDEDRFVADLLGRLGPVPAYFDQMALRNAAGPTAADLTPPPLLGFEQAARLAGPTWVVDTRDRRAFARGHLPGSVNVDAAGALATWVGWTVPVDEPIVVVATDRSLLAHVQRELVRIGVDHLAGAVLGDPPAGMATTLGTARFEDLAFALADDSAGPVLDVRDDHEWRTGHVRGAVHVPAHRVREAVATGLTGEDPWVYCGVGFRAAVAGSLLAREGVFPTVVHDDVALAAAHGAPWCSGSHCPDHRCLG